MKAQQGKPYTVSFFGSISLVLAILMYLYATTFNPEEVQAFFTMLILLIVGVLLSFIMVGIKFIPFTFKSLSQDLVSTLGCFMSVYFLNRIVVAQIGISPMGELAFGILAGVSEEWFFRLWLCAWVHKITRSMLIAIFVSSFTWAIFHIARYGANMGLIWLVFFVGLPLGYFTLIYRSADGPTFGHMLVNFLARK